MKEHDPLGRLFKSAVLARREEAAGELRFPTQARILAAWRAGREESEAFLPLLRKAILAAVTVTVLAVAFTLLNAQTGQQADVDEIVAATNSVNEAIELVWTDDR
jgi:hypothetical protein